MTADQTNATQTKRCRYCGEEAHIPKDACLTTAQKVGQIVGWLVLAAILLFVVGLVVMLATAF